jgi:hypothetical protein
VKDVVQAAALSQTAEGLKAGFHSQALVNNQPDSLGVAS